MLLARLARPSAQWKIRLILGLGIAMLGFGFQLILQQAARPAAANLIYFQKWTSETMVQTVSIADLRDAPLQSLLNIHIQPPAFDAIRAVFAAIWSTPDSARLLQKVDKSLYLLGAALYGLLGGLIFWWLARLTRIWFALPAAAFFLAHPASIFYATLLEGSFLSTVLILWAYYLLWRLKQNPGGSLVPLGLAFLALFFTRSIFQLPAVLVFAFSLLLLGVPFRRALIFLALTGGLASAYILKQEIQFGIPTTSSFTGLNLVHAVGMKIKFYDLARKAVLEGAVDPGLPSVLQRKVKIYGETNFNNLNMLALNQQLQADALHYLAVTPLVDVLHSFVTNAEIYWTPSSRYTGHVIVDRLPWRDFYDGLFSFPVLLILIGLAGAAWLAGSRGRYMAGLGLLLPALLIIFVSIFFEKGENMRFKFFIEPVFFVFISAQLFGAGQQAARRLFPARRPAEEPIPGSLPAQP